MTGIGRWVFRKGAALFVVSSILYLLVALSVFVLQRRLEYFPSHRDVNAEGDEMFSPWKNQAHELLGYTRTSTKAARNVLLFFHGNGGEALHREWITQVASPHSIVVLAEYPGFGGRAGTPTQTSLYQSAQEIYDETSKRFHLPVLVVGQSLGTGVATYLSSTRNVWRLALISPFSSAAEVGVERYPFLPIRWMMYDQFDSRLNLKSVLHVPLHVIHGERDTTVPFRYGKALYESYTGGPKEFTTIPQAGHNDITYSIVHSALAKPFRDFIRNDSGVEQLQLKKNPPDK